jgi:hypothetical protein
MLSTAQCRLRCHAQAFVGSVPKPPALDVIGSVVSLDRRDAAAPSLRSNMPRGGHFTAMEEPELLAEDLRGFFRDLR